MCRALGMQPGRRRHIPRSTHQKRLFGRWHCVVCSETTRVCGRVAPPRAGSEALAQHRRALLVPFGARHPEGLLVLHNVRQHAAPEEHHVLAPRRVLDAQLELVGLGLVALGHSVEVALAYLLLEARGQPGVHGRATREHDVLVQVWPHVHVRLIDRVEDQRAQPFALDADEAGLEERLGRLESLGAHFDDAAIGQRVLRHDGGGLERKLLLQLEVVPHVAHLLLDLTHRLEVRRPIEGVPPQQQQLDQVLGQMASRDVEALDLVGQREPFVHRHDVGHAVARVDHDTRE
mmetsp:Transcript_16672/g.33679  ORF Transcript_16672/g.33679 Transcript_16672/m.33679 type:complete len:290 (+) Transcript_16672:186-1055(+)